MAGGWLAAWPLAELDGARPDGWGVGVWGCEAEKKNKKKTEAEGEGSAYDACNRSEGWDEWYYRYRVTNI